MQVNKWKQSFPPRLEGDILSFKFAENKQELETTQGSHTEETVDLTALYRKVKWEPSEYRTLDKLLSRSVSVFLLVK